MAHVKKWRIRMVSLMLMLIMVMAMVACSAGETASVAQDKKEESPYQFVFTGETEIGGTNYHSTIYGDKDETFSLRIEELPVAELTGTWVFVEKKGYKLYFDDTNSSFVYTKYDPETKDFSFNYSLDLGDTNGGAGQVNYVCKDEQFAAEYDGEGLGRTPPIFTGYTTWMGAMLAVGEPMKCVLTCFEDGTCTSISTNEVKFASPRSGTWSYDEQVNVYTFEMEPEPFESTTYWKFKHPIGTPLSEAEANWTFMGEAGEEGCYWEMSHIEEPYTNNTFTTVYDEEAGIYYLLLQHGLSGGPEYCDRYMAYQPE